MAKITDAINVIVNENLLYSLLVSSGLVNYTSLARKIKPQVESVTGSQVKINSIVKALTGIKSEKPETRTLDILKKSRLLAEYKFSESYFEKLDETGEGVMLAVNESGKYRCILKSEETSDLTLIRILLPEESAGEPGITLLVVEYLNAFGHRIKNIYRLDKEIWLTVKISEAGIVLDRLGKFLYQS